MRIYKIEITETLSKIVAIEANSEEEALAKINDQYKKQEIILDEMDFVDVDFLNIES